MLKKAPRDREPVGCDDLTRPGAFERAYQDYVGGAFAAAVRILHDDAAAEHVVQDVFLSLWRNPAAFDPGRGSLASYVGMVARSRALDRCRSRTAGQAAVERRADQDHKLGDDAEGDAAEAVLGRERTGRLLAALADVPPPQRQAVLASAHGLTCSEIARLAGIPVGTAKSRVRNGLVKAHAALGGAT